ERRDDLKHYAASIRYKKEAGPLTTDLGGGVTVILDTTVASQSKMSSAAQQAQVNPNFTVNWKQVDGTFVLLNASQILKMNENVRDYIQTCYNTEMDCASQIQAGTITTRAEVDAIFGF